MAKVSVITIIWLTLIGGQLQAAISCTLGEPEVVLTNGQYGLKYFPDERLAVIRTKPDCRVIIAAGVRSVLLEGKTMETLGLPKDVLLPGKAGEFDSGYAGISGVWRVPSGELLAIYHAEDHEGMKRNDAGIPGFYCRIAFAVSNNDGLTFEKRGRILSGQLAKVAGGRFDQGVGEPCLVAEPAGKFLYVYYSSHEPIEGRGVQICLARCPVADAMKPGGWQKFHAGGFGEPGLGGRDTPVVSSGAAQTDALFPHVVYVPALRQFVMLFCMNAWRERDRPDRSGFYVAFSDDGIRWPRERMQQIWKTPVIAVIGRQVAWHPTLILDRQTKETEIKGWVYYGYSEIWGHRPPHKPHYLMRRLIFFTTQPE